MSYEDEAELEWWRKNFTCRFGPDNLPTPGTPLYGRRFVLMENVRGELQEVSSRRRKTVE